MWYHKLLRFSKKKRDVFISLKFKQMSAKGSLLLLSIQNIITLICFFDNQLHYYVSFTLCVYVVSAGKRLKTIGKY